MNINELELLSEQELDLQLNEVFDDSKATYPPIDLKPKSKIPQVYGFNFPGTDKFALFFGSYKGKNPNPTTLKPGELIAQLVPLSISEKGNPQPLKGGLGDDPIGALNSIYYAANSVADMLNLRGFMLRFPLKQMKGKGAVLTRVMTRLVKQKSGGKWEVLPTPYKQSDKYAFVFVVKKAYKLNVLNSVIIDMTRFEQVDIGGVPTYVDKANQKAVTKEEAQISSLVARENERPYRAVVSKAQNSIDKATMVKMYSKGDMSPNLRNALINSNEFVSEENTPVDDTLSDATIKKLVGSRLKDSYKDVVTTFAYEDRDKFRDALRRMDFTEATNHKVLFDNLYELVTIDNTKDPELINKRLRQMLRETNNTLTGIFEKRTKKFNAPMHQIDAVQKYTGSAFSSINGALLGSHSAGKITIETINDMDEAFAQNGVQLPKGTTLYRGMNLPDNIARNVLDNKMFYFANYASCSIKPIIFDSSFGFGNTYGTNLDTNTPDDTEGYYNALDDDKLYDPKVGFVISDTHKTKVINCVSFSNYPQELEVLLPRGTVLKITKLVDQQGEKGREFGYASYMAYSKVVSHKFLNEEYTGDVYDGDHLMETGELKVKFSFKGMLNEEADRKDDIKLQSFANCMDLEGLTDKFMV